MFEFPCIITQYYIKNQQDASLAVCLLVTARSLYMFGCFPRPSSGVLKTIVTATGACHGWGWCISSKDVQGWLSTALCHSLFGLGHPYWIYIIPTHDMHQWLLLKFLVLLMMGTESVRNIYSDLAVTNKQYCQSCILLVLYITYIIHSLHRVNEVFVYTWEQVHLSTWLIIDITKQINEFKSY
jgi:hypothetical protein